MIAAAKILAAGGHGGPRLAHVSRVHMTGQEELDLVGARQFWLMRNGGEASELSADFQYKIGKVIHTAAATQVLDDGTTLAEAVPF